jgi:hypothetical protein
VHHQQQGQVGVEVLPQHRQHSHGAHVLQVTPGHTDTAAAAAALVICFKLTHTHACQLVLRSQYSTVASVCGMDLCKDVCHLVTPTPSHPNEVDPQIPLHNLTPTLQATQAPLVKNMQLSVQSLCFV